MHLHVIVRMRGSVENGARGVGAVLMGGQGVEGLGEGWDGCEWLVCGEGISRECSGCGESGKREAECAARGVPVRNGTPEAGYEVLLPMRGRNAGSGRSKAAGRRLAELSLWMLHPPVGGEQNHSCYRRRGGGYFVVLLANVSCCAWRSYTAERHFLLQTASCR